MEPKLTNRVIVLERQEDQVFFGWDLSLPISSVSGFVAGQLYRITHFDEHERILHLKADGKAPQSAYKVSFTDNTSFLQSMDIRKIAIRQHGFYGLQQSDTHYTQPVYTPPPPAPSAYQPLPPRQPPGLTTFSENLTFDIRDAIFDDGTIKFDVKLKFPVTAVSVTLNNPSVKKHFDAVKNYIWKLLGKRKTPCNITFEMTGGKVAVKSVNSCELLHLNESILEQINEDWVEEYILGNVANEIYPIADVVEQLSDDAITPGYVFEYLVKESKTKHYNHLRYLSARQSIDLQKLSVTGKPLSFVFLVRVNENVYLIWETYTTSEATYIWKLPSGVSDIKNSHSLILALRKNNRMMYRRQKKTDFYFIEHDYQADLNGFLKWKQELEKILV